MSYPGIYKGGILQATGVAFDCSYSPDGKCQPSLEAMMKGIGTDIGEDIIPYHNLSYLTDQGVMMSNRALNCKLFMTGTFMGKWDFFWEYFLQEIIAKKHIGVPILLLGKEAEKLRRYIFEMANPTFKLEHPSFAARTDIPWNTNGIFTKINKIITTNFAEVDKIIWNKDKFQQLVDSVPF